MAGHGSPIASFYASYRVLEVKNYALMARKIDEQSEYQQRDQGHCGV